MKVEHEITLQVGRKNYLKALVFAQGDINSHFLKVTFADWDTTIPAKSGVATINAERVDGQTKSFGGVINEDGTVTVPITDWILELDDYVYCTVTVTDSSSKMTSASFEIDVERNANPNGAVSPDDPNYDTLIVLMEQVEASASRMAAEYGKEVYKSMILGSASGAVVSFADGADYIPVKSLVIEVEPKQDETPSADNIVPIEGYTSFSCSRVGKNFANPENIYNTSGASYRYDSEKGTLTVSGTQQYAASYFSIRAKKGVKYIFSAYAEDFEGEDSNARLGIRRGTATQLVASTTSITTPDWLSIGYTAVANEYLRFTLFTGYGHSGSKETTYSHIQVEIATSRTPYERFEEHQIFEPSLVDALYGGTLNLTNGVLTKTWENIESYAGESLPGRWLSDRDVYAEGVTPTTGAQVVYELESPVVTDGLTTYEVKTLYGYNNILCVDADNANIDVEYRADTGLYIDNRLLPVRNLIAGVETEMTATKNYAIGAFFIVGDNLYKATSAIASGESIVVGTNCVVTTVAEQLATLYTLVNS